MDQWKKTTCVLCVNFCGLEALIENNQIMKARGGR
jgi:Pyruvate/2-oxoacid:ferredoxin oxidoreductase delta subunit